MYPLFNLSSAVQNMCFMYSYFFVQPSFFDSKQPYCNYTSERRSRGKSGTLYILGGDAETLKPLFHIHEANTRESLPPRHTIFFHFFPLPAPAIWAMITRANLVVIYHKSAGSKGLSLS